MQQVLQGDRGGERDGVSVLSVSSCSQRRGNHVAGAVADEYEEVVTGLP